MQPVVNATCRGTAQRGHALLTVAQFRYDDGWARVYPRGSQGHRDPILGSETGELRMLHIVHCPACGRTFPPIAPERLYPVLDWARAHGKDVALG